MRSSIVTTRPNLISVTIVLLLLIFLVIELQTGAFFASREVSSSPESRQQSIMAVLTVAGKAQSNEGGPLELCFPLGAWPGLRIEQDKGLGVFYFARLAALGVIGGRLRPTMAVGLDNRGSNPGPSSP